MTIFAGGSFAFLKNQLGISLPALQDFEVACLPALGLKATSWQCRFLNSFLWRRLSPSLQTALKKFPDPDNPGALPLSHRQHRYQSQLTDYMAFSLRSKRLSIPKGEEPGFTAAEFSRSFRETRSFDHLAALGVHSLKGRRISAAILGTEPSKLPSPCRPGFKPRTAASSSAPPKPRGSKSSGFRARCARHRGQVQGKSHLHSGRRASRNSHKFPKARPQSPKSLRSFTEESLREGRGSQAGSDTCWHLSSIPGASHQALPGPTLSGNARLPPEDRSSILAPAEAGSVDLPGRWKRR